jgi:hypothetical protein
MASIADSMAGDRASAGRFLDEAQAVAAGADDVAATVGILQARALKGAIEGDFETVKLVATEGARLSREAGDLYALHSDLNESKRRQEEALRIDGELSHQALLYCSSRPRRAKSVNHKQDSFAIAPRRPYLLDELLQGLRNGLAIMCNVDLPHGFTFE